MLWRRTRLNPGDSGSGEAGPAHDERPGLTTSTDATEFDATEIDATEFNALVEQHAEKMLGVAAAIVGMADAEDVAQEAIVRAWQAWPTLRDRDAFGAWLLRITVKVGRDWLRGHFGTHRRLTELLLELETEADIPVALFADDPGASDHAAALDLRHAIGELDAELRVVVALRYYAGLDATEIGNALGAPPATIRTRLRRALRVLRERLTPSGEPKAIRGREEDRHG